MGGVCSCCKLNLNCWVLGICLDISNPILNSQQSFFLSISKFLLENTLKNDRNILQTGSQSVINALHFFLSFSMHLLMICFWLCCYVERPFTSPLIFSMMRKIWSNLNYYCMYLKRIVFVDNYWYQMDRIGSHCSHYLFPHIWLMYTMILLVHLQFSTDTTYCMGVTKVAQHALNSTKKCALTRGGTYCNDAFNMLYSLCSLATVADALSQSPPVPTRELVSPCFCFFPSLFNVFVTCYRVSHTSIVGVKHIILMEMGEKSNQYTLSTYSTVGLIPQKWEGTKSMLTGRKNWNGCGH